MNEKPLQAALEILTPAMRAPDPSEALVAAKCIGLMVGYDARWQDAPYLIEDVECTVISELRNPDSGARSRTFRTAGKIDVRARDLHTGQTVLIDHKTTSQDIADPNAPYWRQLAIEGQVNHYFLMEWQEGRKVDYGLWDVVRKPGISPKQVAKKEREFVFETGVYFLQPVSSACMEELRETERETLPMYALRLEHECGEAQPERYFQRRQVPRLNDEIYEYGVELWGHAQDLIAARRLERHPRNSGACMLYGSPCKFLGLCSGHDTLDSGKWVNKLYVHNELPASLDEDGRDLLTNSRIRTWQTCRRKHQLEYELGVERVDEEEREALFFGTLFHQALEAYFLELKRQHQGA